VGTKVKYLRRLPRDPITGSDEWATRSSRDKPGSFATDGMNIFDVHSKSDAVALDGTRYATW
jgi:general secretion pathway protein G